MADSIRRQESTHTGRSSLSEADGLKREERTLAKWRAELTAQYVPFASANGRSEFAARRSFDACHESLHRQREFSGRDDYVYELKSAAHSDGVS